MLSPSPCQSPPSAIRVCMYCHCVLVKGFSCYCSGHVRANCQLSESACIVAAIGSEASHCFAWVLPTPTIRNQTPYIWVWWFSLGPTINYQNLHWCVTDCHSNRDITTLYAWNECSQCSINCIPILNHQTNIYYVYKQLQILIFNYSLPMPPGGSWCCPILTFDCVKSVHMYTHDVLYHLWRDSFPFYI